MLRHRFSLLPFAVLATLALVAAGCTAASPSPSAGGAGPTTVDITLQEFSVIAEPATAPAGSITFHVTNAGPDDIHEFVVFKTDLAPDALPTADDGSVDESGEGVELIGEIEDIAVDASEDLTEPLEAGTYVLICNIVESGEVHYELGMRTAFTVE